MSEFKYLEKVLCKQGGNGDKCRLAEDGGGRVRGGVGRGGG